MSKRLQHPPAPKQEVNRLVRELDAALKGRTDLEIEAAAVVGDLLGPRVRPALLGRWLHRGRAS